MSHPVPCFNFKQLMRRMGGIWARVGELNRCAIEGQLLSEEDGTARNGKTQHDQSAARRMTNSPAMMRRSSLIVGTKGAPWRQGGQGDPQHRGGYDKIISGDRGNEDFGRDEEEELLNSKEDDKILGEKEDGDVLGQ